MIHAVLDTNIYISAFLFGGIPKQIIDECIAGRFKVYISEAILDELSKVLRRDKFGLSDFIVHEFTQEVESIVEIVFPAALGEIIERDKDDDIIIECAVGSGSQYIVTGDDDLLSFKNYKNIDIVAPAYFLDSIL